MDCITVEHQLSAYLDDELPEDRARQIRMHLFKCEACETKAADLRRAYDFIRDDEKLVMDAFFTTRLQAEIHTRSRRKKFAWKIPQRFWIPTGIAVCVLLAVFVSAEIHENAPSLPAFRADYIDYRMFTVAPPASYTAAYLETIDSPILQGKDDE